LVLIQGAQLFLHQCYFPVLYLTTKLLNKVVLNWWTALIKPKLLFSRAGYAPWGLSLSSVFFILKLLQDLKRSGKFLDGDGVMADKGFRIESDLQQLGLQLNIPPLASSSCQMKIADVNLTEKIASYRVHIERAISRVKKFKILDKRVDLSLFSSINQIWFVCCFLTNFVPFLIPKWFLVFNCWCTVYAWIHSNVYCNNTSRVCDWKSINNVWSYVKMFDVQCLRLWLKLSMLNTVILIFLTLPIG